MVLTRSKKRKGDIFVELNFTPKKRKSKPVIMGNIVDHTLELTDPTPDVEYLFATFDAQYFAGLLSKNHVTVAWRSRVCFGEAGRCDDLENPIVIELNDLLLKLRPRRDLVETLLHEMIHAYLSIKSLCDIHGPNFLKEMDRINSETGANVTVYHDFLDEVALYENRLWRCNGKCRNRPTQFGFIRNEPFRSTDFQDRCWWSYHLVNCGGSFERVKWSYTQSELMKLLI